MNVAFQSAVVHCVRSARATNRPVAELEQMADLLRATAVLFHLQNILFNLH